MRGFSGERGGRAARRARGVCTDPEPFLLYTTTAQICTKHICGHQHICGNQHVKQHYSSMYCLCSLPSDLVPQNCPDRPQLLVLLKSSSAGKRKRKTTHRGPDNTSMDSSGVYGPQLVHAFMVSSLCSRLLCIPKHVFKHCLACKSLASRSAKIRPIGGVVLLAACHTGDLHVLVSCVYSIGVSFG